MSSDDRGSATVYVLAAAVLVAVLSTPVVVVAFGFALHRQAVRAADLAALAGSQQSLLDPGSACRVAHQAAAANGGVLRQCVVRAPEVRVVVEVPTRLPLLPALTAAARAGVRAEGS